VRNWVLVLALFGCAPKVHVASTPFEEDDPRAGPPKEAPKPRWEELPEAPVAEGAREGTMTRAALHAVLDAGPGALLRHVEVAAELEGERFLGWRLVAIDPQHRGFDGVDLRPDDILVALNGRPLSRPDELAALWDQLRGADVVVADLRRGPGKLQLRWTVTD
jgi:hypothetical protein